MEIIKHTDNKLICTRYVGKGTLDSGEEVELRTTFNYAPIIVFPDGDMVILDWNYIYNIAKEYREGIYEKDKDKSN
ncbi:MAG: hypothetical protein IKP07_04275 [Bacilli bacterium]|nr:hypothetical protein [Bacilli bacterium]